MRNFDKEVENMRISLDPQEQSVILYCDSCNAEIYKGEEYYETEINFLCEKCFDEAQYEQKKECKRIAGDN